MTIVGKKVDAIEQAAMPADELTGYAGDLKLSSAWF